MPGYDKSIADKVMLILYKNFPQKSGDDDIRAQLRDVQLSNDEPLASVSALQKQGLVRGAFLKSGVGDQLGAFYEIELSEEGLAWIEEQGMHSTDELEAIFDLEFAATSRTLYEDLNGRMFREIREEASKHGIAALRSFAAQITEAVYERLVVLSKAFVKIYVEQLADSNEGITRLRATWLLEKLEKVWEAELLRARTEASHLIQGLGMATLEAANIAQRVEIQGRQNLKQNLRELIQAAALKKRARNTPVEKGAHSMSVNIVYNLTGHQARVNVNTTDSSTNTVTVTPDKLFADLREAIERGISDAGRKREALSHVADMEKAQGKSIFAAKYQSFISSIADHVTIIAPFIPALTQMIIPS